MNPRIMLAAGEVSGDVQGAKLAQEIWAFNPQISLFGSGGPQMAASGVKILADYRQRAVIGFFEAFQYLPAYFFLFFKMKKILASQKPDLLVLIDNQGFNLPLAKEAKLLGIPTIYYIAPQEWIWGSPQSLKNVSRLITKILAIFPEEAELYQKSGANVSYIGHPVVDLIDEGVAKSDRLFLSKELGLNPDKKYLALLPGSRLQEIKNLSPFLFKAANLIKQALSDIEFLIPVASEAYLPLIKKIARKQKIFDHFYLGKSQNILKVSELALTVSGTVTLEAALLETPLVIIYKLLKITEFVGRRIFKINLPMIGLPNLILGEKIIPELIQEEVTAQNIAEAALKILRNPAEYQRIKQALVRIKEKIGPGGAVKKAAFEILKLLPIGKD